MDFPLDIKNCMKDCILSIFWPRQQIFEFLKTNGCTTQDLKRIESFQEAQLARGQMVDLLFQQLELRTDKGIGQFRSMLQSLMEWAHFDKYYFDKLRKLDRSVAERNINHLKQLAEIRDARLKEERERRIQREVEKQNPKKTLDELKALFLNLMRKNASSEEKQNRGYQLERILIELAKLSSLTITDPFRNKGEQLDGAFKYEGEHYLLEARWRDKDQSNESLYQFAHKTEGRMYGRGVFVSVNGFSDDAVKMLVVGKAIKTILVDGEDLILVLEGSMTFAEMIDAKVKSSAASTARTSSPPIAA